MQPVCVTASCCPDDGNPHRDAARRLIGHRDRRLAIVQIGAIDLGIGNDEGLLVDAANTLQIADKERIPGAAVTRMLALKLARLFFGLGPFPRRSPASRSALGQNDPAKNARRAF